MPLLLHLRAPFLLTLALASVLTGTGCTYAMVNSSTRYVSLRPGTNRSEITKVLGTPTRSQTFRPPVAGTTFANAPASLRLARVSLYEEYHPNGLIFTDTYFPYRGFSMGYTMGMYVTLGLGEVIYFPYFMGDLARRGSEHYQLRLWYDSADRLIAGEDSRGPDPDHPRNLQLRQTPPAVPDGH